MDKLNIQSGPVLLRIPSRNPHTGQLEYDRDESNLVSPKRNLIHIKNQEFQNLSPTLLAYSNRTNQANYIKPKLIDLRPILKQKKPEKIDVEKVLSQHKREPKLIRLPLVETKTRFLKSPPQKRDEVFIKPASPVIPPLIDLRPQFSEDTSKVLLNTLTSSNNQNRNLSFQNRNESSTVGKENINPSNVSQKRNRRHAHRNSDEKLDVMAFVKESIGKNKRREDQLFEIINEILTQKRAKRNNKKELRLFDIIDNIPVTSESDSDEDFNNHVKRYSNLKTNNTLKSFGLGLPKILQPSQPQKNEFPEIPTFHKTVNKTPMINEASSDYIKQTSKVVNKEEENDPFSWVNLVREFRYECKSTQTIKNITKDNHTKEVQTELEEMIEIPKSQTFFLDPSPTVNKEKTKEFCDRVRKEVIEKLEYQEKLEDKVTQTICHACVQTDVFEEHDEQDSSVVSRPNVARIENSVHPENIIPPNIYSGLKTEVSSEQFINVADVERLQEEVDIHKSVLSIPLISDNGKVTRRSFEKKSNKIDVSTMKSKKTDKSSSSSSSSNSSSDLSSENGKKNKKKKKDKGKREAKILENNGRKKDSQHSQPESFKLPGKSMLYESMNEFSYGLKALEDLQGHIEVELKQSRLLFNTITVLQDGFNEESRSEIKGMRLFSPIVPMNEGERLGTVWEAGTSIRNDIKIDEDSVDEGDDPQLHSIYTRKMEQLDENSYQNDLKSFSPSCSEQHMSMSLTYDDGQQVDMLEDGRQASMMDDGRQASMLDENNHYKEYEGKEFKEQDIKNDALKKEEIRKKFQLDRPTEEEIKDKLENEERSRLLTWMKEKQTRQRSDYLQGLTEKRASEHHPFMSNAAYTRRQINQNTTIQTDLRKAMLDENNQLRKTEAERIAYEAFRSSPKFTPSKRKLSNDRYYKPAKGIPIRETRSSKLRKNALVREVMKHKAELRNQTSKLKSTNKDRKKENLNGSCTSFVETHLDQSFDIRRDARDKSAWVVHPDQFVTTESYMKYRKKAVQRFEDGTSIYNRHNHDDVMSNRNTPMSLNKTHSTTSNYLGTLNESSSVNDVRQVSEGNLSSGNVDKDLVKNILKSYGLQMDKDLFERKSETSLLLNEADLALLDDDTSSQMRTNETVDWEEVDRILANDLR